MSNTLFDKLWDEHTIVGNEGEPQLLYVDVHLMHEVTSPQAFEGLRLNGRKVRRPDKTLATADHVIPTVNPTVIDDPIAKLQYDTLVKNCKEFGVTLKENMNSEQGIIHTIGPELGFVKTGQIVVCGDSHTATHGALGNIAFGIGTSEVEHVLATQTLWQVKPKTMRITYTGSLPPGTTPKDLILYTIRQLGVGSGLGYAVEYAGDCIKNMTIEQRLTITNMAIEMGAKYGIIAADGITKEYISEHSRLSDGAGECFRTGTSGRSSEGTSTGEGSKNSSIAMEENDECKGAVFDKEITIDISKLEPQVSWGTNPSQVVGISEVLPVPSNDSDVAAYKYTGLTPGTPVKDIPIGYVFVGSCTNGRLSDLEQAAEVVKGKHISPKLTAIVVPGSRTVKLAAEKLGLDKVFKDAGFEWREPGCSMCLGMNPDKVLPGIHCASTSNRNFEGRQGKDSITHLCSPRTAALAALQGHF
jgi:3-isopropylmalate/(R)-2-methylmalate dehydratase large subunit